MVHARSPANRSRPKLLVAALLASVAAVGCAAPRDPAPRASPPIESDRTGPQNHSIVPDPALQALIHQRIHAPSPAARAAAIARLRSAARPAGGGDETDRLLEQAAHYAAHARQISDEEQINDVPDGTMALIYVRQALEVPEDRVAAVLAPHLGSRDAKLRRFVFDDALGGGTFVDEQTLSEPAVAGLARVVGRDLDAPPWPAAQVLYWKAPTAAVLEFAGRLEETDPLGCRAIRDAVAAVVRVTAEPIDLAGGYIRRPDPRRKNTVTIYKPWDRSAAAKRDAAAALAALSRREEWWVKLYVAEMMRRYDRDPRLRRGDIVNRLRRDPNPVIARAADVPYHHGASANERYWWVPFPLDDESELKYLRRSPR